MTSPTLADLKAFFRDGHTVCPFASQPARFAEIDRGHPLVAPRALIKALHFSDDVHIAVLVAPEVPDNHQLADAIAGEMLGRLFYAQAERIGEPARLDDVLAEVRSGLANPGRHLQLVLGDRPLYNIAMSPAYRDREHPRYAPRLCVVLT